MKKLLLLFFILIIGCSNPLDKVYEPLTFRTDFRAVQEFDSLSSIKIAFVIDYETPALGATYQEILNRFPKIQEELRIQDSILNEANAARLRAKEELRLQELEIARLTRITDSLRDVRTRAYVARRNEQKRILQNILDEWAVPGNYRQIILEEFDETPGNLKIGEVRLIDGGRLSIDIGPRTLYALPNLIKANKVNLID
jgi:hypothetical protein